MRLVGWSMGAHPDAELVVDALVMALGRAEPDSDGLVHHSDKGGAYVSGDVCSMAHVADVQTRPAERAAQNARDRSSRWTRRRGVGRQVRTLR
jgi:transposase InsO family protein